MNATQEYTVIKVRDGYSISEAGRISGEYQACGDAINVVSVESLLDGEARDALALRMVENYLRKKEGQVYTFDDVEAARKYYPQGFLQAYERVASKRRELARLRGRLVLSSYQERPGRGYCRV